MSEKSLIALQNRMSDLVHLVSGIDLRSVNDFNESYHCRNVNMYMLMSMFSYQIWPH